MGGRAIVLAYHNVVPDEFAGMGDRSLHLPLTRFCRQIEVLQAYCHLASLSDVLSGNYPRERPVVAVTFDDAYAGAVELALPILHGGGLPCTMFVAPGLLGCRSFWWDELAELDTGLTDRARRVALEVHGGQQDLIRTASARRADRVALPEPFACASEAQIRAVGKLDHISLGAHSWSHPNLCRIGNDRMSEELARPLEWLGKNVSRVCPWLAYPYGLHSPAVEAAVEKAGYTAALRVSGGWIVSGIHQAYSVPRYNVPAGLSEDGLILRLSGFFMA